jgi:hypothetical membrane protein
MRTSKALLTIGIMVPVLYFGTLFVAGRLAPGYSHYSQYASELGMKGEPSAAVFNAGILLTALAIIAASGGLYLDARERSASRLWPPLAGLALGLALIRTPGMRSLGCYLLATTVLMALLLAPMMGVGGLVTRANVGLFQRLYALSIFGWVGVACAVLWRNPPRPPETASAG